MANDLTKTEALRKLLDKNIPLHLILLSEVNELPFGTITVNVEIREGIAQLESLNVVRNRRKKYKAHEENI